MEGVRPEIQSENRPFVTEKTTKNYYKLIQALLAFVLPNLRDHILIPRLKNRFRDDYIDWNDAESCGRKLRQEISDDIFQNNCGVKVKQCILSGAVSKYDISSVVFLLLHSRLNLLKKGNWRDQSLAKVIEEIGLIRNELVHKSKPNLKDKKLEEYKKKLTDVFRRVDFPTGGKYCLNEMLRMLGQDLITEEYLRLEKELEEEKQKVYELASIRREFQLYKADNDVVVDCIREKYTEDYVQLETDMKNLKKEQKSMRILCKRIESREEGMEDQNGEKAEMRDKLEYCEKQVHMLSTDFGELRTETKELQKDVEDVKAMLTKVTEMRGELNQLRVNLERIQKGQEEHAKELQKINAAENENPLKKEVHEMKLELCNVKQELERHNRMFADAEKLKAADNENENRLKREVDGLKQQLTDVKSKLQDLSRCHNKMLADAKKNEQSMSVQLEELRVRYVAQAGESTGSEGSDSVAVQMDDINQRAADQSTGSEGSESVAVQTDDIKQIAADQSTSTQDKYTDPESGIASEAYGFDDENVLPENVHNHDKHIERFKELQLIHSRSYDNKEKTNAIQEDITASSNRNAIQEDITASSNTNVVLDPEQNIDLNSLESPTTVVNDLETKSKKNKIEGKEKTTTQVPAPFNPNMAIEASCNAADKEESIDSSQGTAGILSDRETAKYKKKKKTKRGRRKTNVGSSLFNNSPPTSIHSDTESDDNTISSGSSYLSSSTVVDLAIANTHTLGTIHAGIIMNDSSNTAIEPNNHLSKKVLTAHSMSFLSNMDQTRSHATSRTSVSLPVLDDGHNKESMADCESDTEMSCDTAGPDEDETELKYHIVPETQLTFTQTPELHLDLLDYGNHTDDVQLLPCLLMPVSDEANILCVDVSETVNNVSDEQQTSYNNVASLPAEQVLLLQAQVVQQARSTSAPVHYSECEESDCI